MSKQRLEFHSDGGHGWLQVPMALVKESGAVISFYSYQSQKDGRGFAYLEEDCDFASFVHAITGMEGRKAMKAFVEDFEIVEVYDGDRSPIRRLPAYRD